MKKTLSLLVMTLIFQGCGGGSSDESTQPIPNPPVVNDDGFDSVRAMATTSLAESAAPAVSIAIYKDGEIVFAEAFGARIEGSSIDVDKDTLFQIGSTTKIFTALATMNLVENNELSLESRLMDVIPEIDVTATQRSGWSEINVFHLLTHQGGFSDEVDWNNSNISLTDYATSTYPNNFDQMNPAGRFFNYSNPNWSYLGAMIEHQKAQPYEQLMEELVFRPLNMQRTTMQKNSVIADGNYALGSGQIIKNGQSINGSAKTIDDIHIANFGKPAGSYTWSTPTEILKMAEFLIHGNDEVLADDLRNQMTQAQVNLDLGIPLNYGFGIFVSDGFAFNNSWYPIKRWQHNGNTLAYSSDLWILPEQDIAVSILSSGSGTNFTNLMNSAIKSVTTLPSGQALPFEPVATELFENHVGHYEGDFGSVDVYLNNGDVHIKSPSLDAEGISYQSKLEPLAGSNFRVFIDGDSTEITFIPEVEGGKSVYIRNRSFVGIRTENSNGVGDMEKRPTTTLATLLLKGLNEAFQ